MDFGGMVVDWNEAALRSAAGTLADNLVDGIDDDEQTWLEAAEIEDNWHQFTSYGRAYEAMRPFAPAGMTADLSASLDRFLREEPSGVIDPPIQLDSESCFLALSPSTVAEMATAFERIDMPQLANLYSAHCPADVRKDFESPAVFVEVLENWKELFCEAAARGRGLIVTVG